MSLFSKAAPALVAALLLPTRLPAQSLMENLGRGLVAVRQSSTQVFVGWRMLGTDPPEVAFNLYRSAAAAPAARLNSAPITSVTSFTDDNADPIISNSYFVRPVVGGIESEASPAFQLPANAPVRQYLSIPLKVPGGGTTPDNVAFTYSANDCSVGDLDGDGEYEIIVKWDPSNSKDNSQSGFTGNVYLDAHKLDGTALWRIDLGRNIRAGAHYTQFMVFDLDGDGRSEVACKTADGTVDGQGRVIGDPNADFRNSSGYILEGPEFLTLFDGLTGAALVTTEYLPARGRVADWGDNYGNRVDRFLAGIAYLDGLRPSLVMCRGYYTRAVLVAWNWRAGRLDRVWTFDSRDGTPGNLAYEGQGNHSLSVGDVDQDGKDEVVYGAGVIDHDGRGRYSTGLGHGDALHFSDLDPDRPGLEIFQPHEDQTKYGSAGIEFRDALTGALLWGRGNSGDVGRGVALDIDPRYRGYEMWGAGSTGGLYDVKGNQISAAKPSQMNFGIWWDGDPLRELLDGTTISKWNWQTRSATTLLSPPGLASNNSTKATPCLSADILGDWREEVLWRTADSKELRVYATTLPTERRIPTLMHDRQYRLAIAWQNVAYNQPPHPSFFLGDGMSDPPPANIITKDTTPPVLRLPATLTVEATGPEGAVASFIAAANDLYSGLVPVRYSIPPGSLFPLGTTRVVVTAVDEFGNAASGTFEVTVRDSTPPALTCPANFTVKAVAAKGILVNYPAATATDAVSTPTISYSEPSGSLFSIGTTSITVSAADATGNSSSCSFKVTVYDPNRRRILSF